MPFDSFLDSLTSHIRDFIPASLSDYFSGGTPTAKNTPLLSSMRRLTGHTTSSSRICNSRENRIYIQRQDSVGPLASSHESRCCNGLERTRSSPRCHPGTRVYINKKLVEWLDVLVGIGICGGSMVPAGTGKSAIAQTFAEACFEMDRLGGTFFFSRPNGRDKPETVVPSLVYQLCTNCEAYKTIVASVLANDPQLLQKAISIQFRRLIIEPFSKLQADCHQSVRRPSLSSLTAWMSVLVLNPVPIHQANSRDQCGREELVLDRESHDDVTKFLHDKFAEIREENPYTTTPDWPSEVQFNVILRISSGHFQVATVSVNYVNDPIAQDPVKQLNTLVAFLEGAEKIGIDNPLAALDLIYTRILSEIPDRILPVTRQILALLLFPSWSVGNRLRSAQVLCNLLRLEQNMFYSALSRLHSVIRVPAPEDAFKKRLIFYHTSFEDYLRDPIRSGKFVLRKIGPLKLSHKHILTGIGYYSVFEFCYQRYHWREAPEQAHLRTGFDLEPGAPHRVHLDRHH
ncbi:hypothetical protein D9756_008265 [Leucocoprinus leucothites]|uniref:Nephrocystin 3-like N-terminal domain-containing protein n=1 Tax=Leucocoprinus leucothites TaxID=201217 RepID=A0A8H5D0C2_9AGAR|nr:hypothetical protein D9756_008265 [Leucoagaricus leucothites]